jgi:hypothetical protein
MAKPPATFSYEPWRHGGWYVPEVRYPSGAVGCVSRNYKDRKWRIACDPRDFEEAPTFRTRDEAARAEWELAQSEFRALSNDELEQRIAALKAKFPNGGNDGFCNWLRDAHASAIAD